MSDKTSQGTEDVQPNLKDVEDQISFEDITEHPEILESLSKNNFTNPTPVQAAAIPAALKGKDLIIQAQTGSGKTLAFAIPLIQRLMEKKPPTDKTFVMVLSPTRELAEQISNVVSILHPEVKPVCVIGGVDIKKQINALNKDRRFVVGTPGRVLDLMRQKELSLRQCEFFALDEADEMLSMGFLEDVRAILTRLPDKRQGIFVSATITPRVDMLANSFLNKPEKVILEVSEDLKPKIDHIFSEVGSDLMAKPRALCDIIETRRPSSAIIFCNTKSDTALVEALLRRRGFDARRLNSDLTQSQRQKVMKKIKEGELQFLIATDIAARGIDIEEMELVINYTIHDQPETYVHRTGRTGRAGRQGSAISLIGPRDFGSFHFIKKVLDLDFIKAELPTDDEVADARLTHLYEILRTSGIEHKLRDKIVAGKLLKELGSIEEPAEDLLETAARLCRYAIEHFVKIEAKSLEEELEADKPEEKSSDKRRSKDNDSKGRGKDRSDKNSRELKAVAEQGSEKNERPERNKPEEVRVYVGQGLNQGMNAKKFTELATSLAGLKNADIKSASFRDFYGFIDIEKDNSEKLIDKLNGADFEDTKLTVEYACSLSINKPRRNNRNSSSNKDRKGNKSRSRKQGGSRSHSRNNSPNRSRSKS